MVISVREELSNILVLNYQKLQQSFEAPLEFSFLSESDIYQLLEQKEETKTSFNFFGLEFNRSEKERLIINPIGEQAEKHKEVTYWETLFTNLGFQLNECWTFEGNSEQWMKFLGENIFLRKKAIILNPKISLKLQDFLLPVQLQPTIIIWYKKRFTLLLQSFSKSTGKSFFAPFIFYDYFFKTYSNIEFYEAAYFYVIDEKAIDYSISLPTIMNPTKNSLNNLVHLHLYLALGLKKPNFSESIFSEFLTESEYEDFFNSEGNNLNRLNQESISELRSSLELFRAQIIDRLKKLDNLAKLIESQLPEEIELSTWYKNIAWVKLITIESLKFNYLATRKSKLFSVKGKLFKSAISLLYPNFPILSSSLIDVKKAFSLIEKNKKAFEDERSNSPISFNYFLSYIFHDSKLKKIEKGRGNSIFSIEGDKLLREKIIAIKWKVYYDFETWEDILTQLSLQIFREEALFYKNDLIRNPFVSADDFQRKCIEELSAPLISELESNWEKEEHRQQLFEFLKNKVVYIAFNKTFECTWLGKIGEYFFSKGDIKISILSQLTRELTIDLSDWFKLSSYSSLNIIGPLLGSHTLKKLVEVVQKDGGERYSQLEWAQNGRTASLLYLYFYAEIFNITNIQKLKNTHLAPINWIKGYKEKKLKEWQFISSFLREYCYYDVQNMVDGVNWLRENYEANRKELVSQSEILSTIFKVKKLSVPRLGELLTSYLHFQTGSMESQ